MAYPVEKRSEDATDLLIFYGEHFYGFPEKDFVLSVYFPFVLLPFCIASFS